MARPGESEGFRAGVRDLRRLPLYNRDAEVAMRILVTGAASGIGRATCLRLARDARAQGKKAQIAAVDIGPSPGLDGLLDEARSHEAEPPAPPAPTGNADAPARGAGE